MDGIHLLSDGYKLESVTSFGVNPDTVEGVQDLEKTNNRPYKQHY